MAEGNLDGRLGRALLASGHVTAEQFSKAGEYQVAIGGQLGKILVKLGYISEQQLAKTLAEISEVTYTDLHRETLSVSLMDLLPRSMMEQRLLLPLRLEQDTLTIAMADPTDLDLVELVQFNTGYHVSPVLARESDIREKLNHYYYDGKQRPRRGMRYGLADLINELKPVPAESSRRADKPSGTLDPPSAEQMVESLGALLIEKGLITKEEWARMLHETMTAP